MNIDEQLRKRLEDEAKTGDNIHLLIKRCLVEDKDRGLRELIKGDKVKEWNRLLGEKWVSLERALAIFHESFEEFVVVPRETMGEFGMYLRGAERLWPKIPDVKVVNPNTYDEGIGDAKMCSLNAYFADFMKVCDRLLKGESFSDFMYVPRTEYESMVHVSRKQLLEKVAFAKSVLKNKIYANAENGRHFWKGRLFAMEELLEASKPNEVKDPCECPCCHQDFSACICHDEEVSGKESEK